MVYINLLKGDASLLLYPDVISFMQVATFSHIIGDRSKRFLAWWVFDTLTWRLLSGTSAHS